LLVASRTPVVLVVHVASGLTPYGPRTQLNGAAASLAPEAQSLLVAVDRLVCRRRTPWSY